MTDEPLLDWPPNLNAEALEAQEQENAIHLRDTLRLLLTYVGEFRAALALFDFCETETAPRDFRRQWRFTAARDGALAIYNFGKTFEECARLVGRSPTVLKFLDRSYQKAARQLLASAFPNFIDVRDAVAHAAELMHNVEENAVKTDADKVLGAIGIHFSSPSAQLMISNGLFDRAYVNTKDGRAQAYTIDASTLNNLDLIRRTYYTAFRRADAELNSLAQNARKAAFPTEPGEPHLPD